MPNSTQEQYAAVLAECNELFVAKNTAYGDSWRMMRFTSLLDLMHAKVHRIDQLMDKVEYDHESIEDSLKDILNYAALALIQYRSVE